MRRVTHYRKPRRFHAGSARCGLFLHSVGRHQRGGIRPRPAACDERTCRTKTPAFHQRFHHHHHHRRRLHFIRS